VPADKTADAQEIQIVRGLKLNRGCSRNSVGAKRFTRNRFLVGRRKPRDRNGRQQFHLRHGLRHRHVSDVADLAMLLVRFVTMPVPGSLHGKQAHGKHEGHGHQSYGDSLRHW